MRFSKNTKLVINTIEKNIYCSFTLENEEIEGFKFEKSDFGIIEGFLFCMSVSSPSDDGLGNSSKFLLIKVKKIAYIR